MNIIVVRRVYVYSAALIGLLMLAAGLRTLVGMLLETLFAPPALGMAGAATRVSASSALVIVGGLLWAGHWWWAQRSLTQPEERFSALRRFYGYLVLGIAMVGWLGALHDLLVLLLNPATTDDGRWPRLLATLAIDGLIWLYHWRVLQHDRVPVEEEGAPATLRRWYLVIIQALGLALLGWNAVDILATVLRRLLIPAIGTPGTPAPLIYALSGLITGLVVWLPHHLWALRLVRQDSPLRADETRSTLRQVYNALVVTITAIAALGALATLLYIALLTWLGIATDPRDYLEPLAIAVVSLPLWWYHRRLLLEEGALGTPPTRATVARRINGYLTAAIGLAGTFGGLVGLVTYVLRLWLAPAPLGPGWQQSLSLSLALTLVALPVYAVTSRRLEQWARREPAEERTVARRVYLYGVLLALVILVIVVLVALLRRLLELILGVTNLDPNEVSAWIGLLSIGLPLLAYHVRLLRRAQSATATRAATWRVALIADPAWQATLVAALRRDLPTLQLQSAPPDDAAQIAAALDGADLVVATLTAAWRDPAATLLRQTRAHRLVLATPLPDSELVGAPAQPEALARVLTRRLRELLATTAPLSSSPAAAPSPSGGTA